MRKFRDMIIAIAVMFVLNSVSEAACGSGAKGVFRPLKALVAHRQEKVAAKFAVPQAPPVQFSVPQPMPAGPNSPAPKSTKPKSVAIAPPLDVPGKVVRYAAPTYYYYAAPMSSCPNGNCPNTRR